MILAATGNRQERPVRLSQGRARHEIRVWLDRDLYDRVLREAAARGTTTSNCVREALDEYFVLKQQAALALGVGSGEGDQPERPGGVSRTRSSTRSSSVWSARSAAPRSTWMVSRRDPTARVHGRSGVPRPRRKASRGSRRAAREPDRSRGRGRDALAGGGRSALPRGRSRLGDDRGSAAATRFDGSRRDRAGPCSAAAHTRGDRHGLTARRWQCEESASTWSIQRDRATGAMDPAGRPGTPAARRRVPQPTSCPSRVSRAKGREPQIHRQRNLQLPQITHARVQTVRFRGLQPRSVAIRKALWLVSRSPRNRTLPAL
jgi:hypothetical protein